MKIPTHQIARQQYEPERYNSKSIIVTPDQRVLFNSGLAQFGYPLPLEKASRMFLRVQNKGYADVDLVDGHWHNDLGTVPPGESKIFYAASLAGKSHTGPVEVWISILELK